MRPRTLASTAVAAALLLSGLTTLPAQAAGGGQLDVVLRTASGTVDPNLGAGLYRDGVGPDGKRQANKVASCTPNLAEGVCSFTGVEPGKYIVESGAWDEPGDDTTKTFYKAGTPGTIDGFAATAITIRDDSYTEIAIRRQQGVTIEGTVTTHENQQAHVQLVPDSPLFNAPPAIEADADAQGRYRLTGLSGASYRLRAQASGSMTGWLGGTDRAQATPLRGAPGSTVKADLTLERAFQVVAPARSNGPWRLTAYQGGTTDEGTQTWTPVASAEGSEGEMTVLSLARGVYRFKAESLGASPVVTWYHGGASPRSSDDVHVDATMLTAGVVEIDGFDLVGGPAASAPSAITATAPTTATAGTPVEVSVKADAAMLAGRYLLLENGRPIAYALADGTAGAKVVATGLKPGMHQLTVYYTGSFLRRAGTSAPVTVTVKAQPTVTAKAATTFRAGKTGKVTVAVRAADTQATGTVAIKYGTTTIGKGTLKGGKVTITTKALKAGKRTLTVVYGGNGTVLAKTVKLKVTVR